VLYLSGVKNVVIADDLATGRIGFLKTPKVGNSLEGVKVWAADNGCFTDSYPGDEAFMAWLSTLESRRSDCLFVAAPDVVGDGMATLAKFPAAAAMLRREGWPVALVGQDGMESLDVPWHLADWLFVGGSTEWKLGTGALELIEQAKANGVRVHIGRVNSAKRYAHFAAVGADTCDGTHLAFGPAANAPNLRRWMSSPVQIAVNLTTTKEKK